MVDIFWTRRREVFRIPLLNTMRERAKSVIADAESLVEKHGEAAYEISREFERNANGLGDAFYWRAVGKVVTTRIRSGVDLLPPTQADNCATCLVERIAGTHDGDGPPVPLACVSCAGQAVGRRLERRQALSQ